MKKVIDEALVMLGWMMTLRSMRSKFMRCFVEQVVVPEPFAEVLEVDVEL